MVDLGDSMYKVDGIGYAGRELYVRVSGVIPF